MISLELITKYLSALDNCELDKTEIKTLVNLLKEFEKMPSEINRIKKEIIKLIDAKAINRYIELDDNQLYEIEDNKIYNIIPVNHDKSKELTELAKEIEDSQNSLDDYIQAEEQRIADLLIKEQKLRKSLALTVKNQKAINSDGFVFVNKDNNFYYTIIQGE